MRVKPFGLAALFAVTGAAVAIGVAPIAVADECDPTATVCQGPDVQTNNSPAGPVTATADQYPFDNDWYYGAPGEMQLTEENPGIASPSYGGGGGHR